MAQAGGCGAGGAGEPEPAELSLEAVLKAYEQPINEEQAWAVCFQGCRGLRGAPGSGRRIRDTADIVLRRDGSVGARPAEDEAGGAGDKEGAAGEWPAARLGVCARPGGLGSGLHGCTHWGVVAGGTDALQKVSPSPLLGAQPMSAISLRTWPFLSFLGLSGSSPLLSLT